MRHHKPGDSPRHNPGPRPLGPRQRAAQQVADEERRQREHAARQGRDAAQVSPPPAGLQSGTARPAAAPPGPAKPEATSVARVPGQTKRASKRDKNEVRRRAIRRNRKSIRWAPLLLQIALGAFAVECIAALLFSPRLRVRTVAVTGNETIPTARLLKRMGTVVGQNLVRLPMNRIWQSVLAEPTVETAEVRREWPDRVTLVVHERKPWASVQTPDGACYTIDAKMVPFRTGDAPEASLPRLRLAPADSDNPVPKVTLGVPMNAPGLGEVARCLAWATNRPDFVLEAVTIDTEGKLCLNRKGGVEIQLGSGSDLNKKLASLELLLEKRPGLKTGTDVAYVNLFAYDAPAIMPRPTLPPATTLVPSGMGADTTGDAIVAVEETAPPALIAAPKRKSAVRTAPRRPGNRVKRPAVSRRPARR